MNRPTVCLAMIVKDEEHCIARCLESVKPFIDCYSICDTGSTDRTVQVIFDTMRDIPGAVLFHDWKDFSTNRNLALEQAWHRADFALMIDADDALEAAPFFSDNLTRHDVHCLENDNHGITYWRPHLMARHSGRFRGVTHEAFYPNKDAVVGKLHGLKYKYMTGGARSNDTKYAKDIELIERALKTEDDVALRKRYQFYLAQSYLGKGDNLRAIAEYAKRVTLGVAEGEYGEFEEVWYSLFQIAEAMAHDSDGTNQSAVIDAYLWAFDFHPKRAETLRGLAAYLRSTGRERAAAGVEKWRASIDMPRGDAMFLDSTAYGRKGL